jgi:hypothetical protein
MKRLFLPVWEKLGNVLSARESSLGAAWMGFGEVGQQGFLKISDFWAAFRGSEKLGSMILPNFAHLLPFYLPLPLYKPLAGQLGNLPNFSAQLLGRSQKTVEDGRDDRSWAHCLSLIRHAPHFSSSPSGPHCIFRRLEQKMNLKAFSHAIPTTKT